MRLVVPVRSVVDGFSRLSPSVPADARREIASRLVRHVIEVATSVAPTLVVTNDLGASAIARDTGASVCRDPGGGLNGAAAIGIPEDGPWAVIHADLPLLTHDDLAEAGDHLLDGGAVLAPSHDGGTSLIGAVGPMEFSYGPGSFRRHLAAMAHASILVRRGFLLDVDSPADVDRLLA